MRVAAASASFFCSYTCKTAFGKEAISLAEGTGPTAEELHHRAHRYPMRLGRPTNQAVLMKVHHPHHSASKHHLTTPGGLTTVTNYLSAHLRPEGRGMQTVVPGVLKESAEDHFLGQKDP